MNSGTTLLKNEWGWQPMKDGAVEEPSGFRFAIVEFTKCTACEAVTVFWRDGLVALATLSIFGVVGLPAHFSHCFFRSIIGLPYPGLLDRRDHQDAKNWQKIAIECWVLATTLVSVGLFLLVSQGAKWLAIPQVILFADMVRVVLLLHLNPKRYQHSQARSLAAIGLHFFESILFFATLVLLLQEPGGFKDIDCPLTGWQAFYFSAVTISTIGYGDLSPATFSLQLIAVTESLVGIVLIVIAISRVMGHDENRSAPGDE